MPEVSETARNSTPEVPVQTDEVRQCVVIEHSVFKGFIQEHSVSLLFECSLDHYFFLDKRGEKPIYVNTT